MAVVTAVFLVLGLAALLADNRSVSASKISLPSGPGSIEGLGESFEPQLNTGTYAIGLPFNLPPVRGAVQPEVRLAYNSGSGNGPLGLGWRLDVPCVQRQTDKGLPQYTDEDTFITLAGEELVALADGTFRAENETAFTRWENLGADGWLATRRDGTVLRYGQTTQGRQDHPMLGTFKWMIESAQDLNGNRVEYSYLKDAGQMYLSAVEFGQHATQSSSFYRLTFEYEDDRPDPLADYRGRFRAETCWRLASATLEFEGRRIRFWRYEYHEDWPLSLLARFTQFGDERSDIGEDARPNVDYLPPVTLEYSQPPLGANRQWSDVEPFQDIHFSMREADLVDLNRDGLPDVLLYDEGRYYSYLNRGPGLAFGAAEQFTSPVLYPALDLPTTKLADLRGDGGVKVLVEEDGSFYYRAFTSATTLGADVDYAVPGDFPLSDPTVQLVDIDNDRALDFVTTDTGDSTFAMVLSRTGTGSQDMTKSPPTPLAMNVNFADGWQFADLNGDRMPDLARIGTVEEGGTFFHPGMGFGEFDELQSMGNGPNGPTDSDRADAGLMLVDLDGDGLADLVSVRSGVVKVWRNLSGGEWAAPVIITDPEVPDWNEDSTAVRFADMNGNGSVDIVWNDPAQGIFLRYLELNPGPKPNMLTRMANGIGRSIEIEYRTSTDYMLEAAATGDPWTMVPPFPIPVVSAFTERDGLHGAYRTEITYRNGYYDALEREFRGFETAIRTDVGDDNEGAPSLVTEFRFDTGAEVEALKGKPLRVERRTESGEVFDRVSNDWIARELPLDLSVNESRTVTFAFPANERTEVIERGSGAPRILLREFEWDDYGNQTRLAEYGIVEGNGRNDFNDERITVTEFALNTERWILHLPIRGEIQDGDGAVISRVEHFYDDETFSGANFGQVSVGNVTLNRAWIIPSDPVAFIEVARVKYDRYGNAVWLLDPLAEAPGGTMDLGKGHLREIHYDPQLHTHPVGETIHLGDGKEPLLSQAEYDIGLGIISASIDFNLNRTSYGHDTFGRLVHVVRPLDTPAFPTAEYDYVLAMPVGGSRSINFVETRQLDRIPGSAGTNKRDHYLISRQFMDGLGRTVLSKHEAEPAEGSAAPRVVVAGATRFNVRQKTFFVLNPFFSQRGETLDELLAFEDIAAPDWQGQFHDNGNMVSLNLANAHRLSMAYDALCREIQTTNPDGTFRRMVYEPLVTWSYDENDSDPASPHFDTPIVHHNDGLGRLVRVDEVTRLNDDGTPAAELKTWTTRYEYDVNDQLTRITDSQSNVKWIEYDGLQRKTFVNDPNRGITHYVYDAASNLIESTDAKNQRVTYTYDGANRIVTEDYHDEGEPFSADRLFDPSQPVSQANHPDVAYFYDEPFPNLPQGDNTTATARNTKGTLAAVWDLSGEEHTSYDERGRVEWVVKRIPDPIFWTHRALPISPLWLVSYRTAFEYDSMDRVTRLTYPDLDQITYEYNDRGVLKRIPGGPNGSILSDLAYLPSGQRTRVAYGNGVRTTYHYDPRLRLSALDTRHPTLDTRLVHFTYDFDAASNIRAIHDQRPGSAVPVGDNRRNTQLFQYDDLYRLTQVQFSFNTPGQTLRNDGRVHYRYDRIGNMLAQTSDIVHDENGLSLTDLGDMESGGTLGRFDRVGRMPDDPPGPHALTEIQNRQYPYDANGNMLDIDGLQCTWDFEDRLVVAENDEMRADYTYDYTDRRITKRVTLKNPSTLNTQSSTDQITESFTTLYVGKHFEVRERDAPTKYIFDDETRVARVTGDLTTNIRVQRIRLWPGWNLVSLAVSASLAADDAEGAFESAFRFDTVTQGWQPVAADEKLPAGTILWLHAASSATFSVTGIYPGSVAPTQAPPGGVFHPGKGLEVAELDRLVPAEAAVWHFDAEQQHWQARLPPPFSSLSSSLPGLGPGQGFFVHSDSTVDLQVPETALSIRYYHQDHLGSSTVICDLDGNLVEESANYPFGHPRSNFRPKGIRENYQFAQKEQDIESRLHYFEARYLAGFLGRFLGVDPMLEGLPEGSHGSQGLNPYAYALNNPLRYEDPSGLNPFEVAGKAMREKMEEAGIQPPHPVGFRDVGRFGLGLAEGGAAAVGYLIFEAPGDVGESAAKLYILAGGGDRHQKKYVVNTAIDIEEMVASAAAAIKEGDTRAIGRFVGGAAVPSAAGGSALRRGKGASTGATASGSRASALADTAPVITDSVRAVSGGTPSQYFHTVPTAIRRDILQGNTADALAGVRAIKRHGTPETVQLLRESAASWNDVVGRLVLRVLDE